MHDEGHTCYDPLFFHYPTLDETFTDTEHTFIVADALKVSPVLEAGVEKIKSYFPNGRWVNLKDLKDVVNVEDQSGGAYVTLNAPTDTVNVHLMPGKIAVFQDNADQSKKLTDDMLNEKAISLILNRDSQAHADGRIFLDDGVSQSSLDNKEYLYYEFHHNQKSLIKQTLNDHSSSFLQAFTIDKVVIADAADLSKVDTACQVTVVGEVKMLTTSFDADKNVLTVTGPINFVDVERIHYL